LSSEEKLDMNSTKKVITMVLLAGACLVCTTETASAGSPLGGLAGAYVRRFAGPAIRQANPAAYSALLAVNRSVPPQVKNNWNNQFNPYRSGGTPWNAELNYWRSMPPEVRNSIDKQQRIARQQQMGYTQPLPPQVIYVVPAPPATVSYGAGAAVIPAPPPPSELPRIIRPN
jgi:hypothetical protein